jgi:tetratricopeptide (TPR) repeat protein
MSSSPPQATQGRHAPAAPEPTLMSATLPTPNGAKLLEQGQAAFNKGSYPEAFRRAQQALSAGGALVGAHVLLGDVYYHTERYGEALREYQAALKLDPENPIASRGRELASKQIEPAP